MKHRENHEMFFPNLEDFEIIQRNELIDQTVCQNFYKFPFKKDFGLRQ